jgi:hypothetical protein
MFLSNSLLLYDFLDYAIPTMSGLKNSLLYSCMLQSLVYQFNTLESAPSVPMEQYHCEWMLFHSYFYLHLTPLVLGELPLTSSIFFLTYSLPFIPLLLSFSLWYYTISNYSPVTCHGGSLVWWNLGGVTVTKATWWKVWKCHENCQMCSKSPKILPERHVSCSKL